MERRRLTKETKKEIWNSLNRKSNRFDWFFLFGILFVFLVVLFLLCGLVSNFVYINNGKKTCLIEVEDKCDKEEFGYYYEGHNYIFPFKNNLSVTCYCSVGEEVGKNEILIIPKFELEEIIEDNKIGSHQGAIVSSEMELRWAS